MCFPESGFQERIDVPEVIGQLPGVQTVEERLFKRKAVECLVEYRRGLMHIGVAFYFAAVFGLLYYLGPKVQVLPEQFFYFILDVGVVHPHL